MDEEFVEDTIEDIVNDTVSAIRSGNKLLAKELMRFSNSTNLEAVYWEKILNCCRQEKQEDLYGYMICRKSLTEGFGF